MVELLLGVVIGPQVLGLEVSEFMQFFASLGLGMLFFFAGYEIDLHRIAGFAAAPGRARLGDLAGHRVHDRRRPRGRGVVVSLLYTGSAIATTAIGTLIPILSDTGS